MSTHRVDTVLDGEVMLLSDLHVTYECKVDAGITLTRYSGDDTTPPMMEIELDEIHSIEMVFKSYFDAEDKDLTLMEYCLRHGREYATILHKTDQILGEHIEEQLQEYVCNAPEDLCEIELFNI